MRGAGTECNSTSDLAVDADVPKHRAWQPLDDVVGFVPPGHPRTETSAQRNGVRTNHISEPQQQRPCGRVVKARGIGSHLHRSPIKCLEPTRACLLRQVDLYFDAGGLRSRRWCGFRLRPPFHWIPRWRIWIPEPTTRSSGVLGIVLRHFGLPCFGPLLNWASAVTTYSPATLSRSIEPIASADGKPTVCRRRPPRLCQ